jgi:choline dehydrogenase-like flavoprotein
MARNEAFDVVVVGGGAAGCVVAARLAERSSRSVLLLEAGPDRRSDLPGGMRDGWTIESDRFDWGYTSEPAAGGVQNLRRTKLLGGTSWLTRFTPRGHPADYDGWAALGNPGWSFDDVLPYFLRLESDLDFGDLPWHGSRGPMPSTRYLDLEYVEIGAAALEGLVASGFPHTEDHNRPGAVGAGRMPMNSRDGVRVTTLDAYLPLGETPPNLTIRSDTEVDRIVFEGALATGVRLRDGSVLEAGWVVLCAGTYGSPTILMRSGVGPAQHLRGLDVPVLVDLPGVGENLADHPAIWVECGYSGIGRSRPILHSIATFRSTGRPSEDTPDLMLWMSDPIGGADDPASFDIDIVLLRPHARGRVRLRSRDPDVAPSIELPGLDTSDVDRLGEAYRLAVDVANRPEIRRLCAGPAPSVPARAELEMFVRSEAYSVPHVVGTCAMGAVPEQGAVVDVAGRVHGTERLTVVDASIMPDVPSGFTHVPTIMLAERLSEQLASQRP